MEQQINERYIQFAGSKSGGSERVPVPFDLEINEDIPLVIKGHTIVYNVVKVEFLNNNDGTVDAVYILRSTLS
jgi:hypothetical protein